jgi:nitroimidazol reductase NimA-like FMN-containing flavoprotein (pyridoxamine 5'-phosphate oxidase superfamily)
MALLLGDLLSASCSRRMLDASPARSECDATMSDATYSVIMHDLDEATCRRLLGRARFGRVAFETADGIAVLPVNAVFSRGAVFFRTAESSSLHALTTSQPVAFQVDHVDHVSESGWSVLARGVASRVDDEATLASLAETDIHPWAPGPRDRWIRIEPHTLTGRHIERHAQLQPGEHLPYMPPD